MKCKYPGCTLDRPLLPYEQTFGYHVRPCLNAKHRAESHTRMKYTNEKHLEQSKAHKEQQRRARGVPAGKGRKARREG